MARHAARRAAMQLIYENIYGGQGGNDTLFGMVEFPAEDEDVAYVYELVEGAVSHSQELDDIISTYSPKREIERLPGITLAILRLALYESLYCQDTPISVIINEAVDMAKRFSNIADSKFINGLLGTYTREHPRA